MPKPHLLTLLLLFIFISCESPQEKISRLQNELLKALGERDYFEIELEKQKIRLPLPPSPELAESRKLMVSEIDLETDAFAKEKLEAEDKKRLDLLSTQLDEIVKRGSGAFFDPVKCVLPATVCDLLESKGQDGDKIMQQLPQYYSEVERRWLMPDRQRAQIAAEQSLLVLDRLENTGSLSPDARLCVKDFIALCRSAVLGQ